jgi:uncharacterized protein YgiM (DUF1202 family)
MKKIIVAAMMCMIGMVFSSGAYAQTEYYVQSVKAKVMSGKTFKSPVLGEVAKGFKFVSSGKEGGWVKVKYKNNDGYVSSLLLSSNPPLDKAGVIKGDDAEIKQGVRRRASSYTSAAAARGLAQDDRRRMNREERADYISLQKIEAFTVSQDEVNRFMEGEK